MACIIVTYGKRLFVENPIDKARISDITYLTSKDNDINQLAVVCSDPFH